MDPALAVIEIQVEEIAQLFSSLDPFPFRERDLDRDAEEFIVGWAREYASNRPFKIVIHLPAAAMQLGTAANLEIAFSRFFRYRAEMIGRDLNELFRVGHKSLFIGLMALAVCLGIGQFLTSHFAGSPLARLLNEGFLILGWVANWKPLEIYLYDWWPLARRRNLYRRLSRAKIEVTGEKTLPHL